MQNPKAQQLHEARQQRAAALEAVEKRGKAILEGAYNAETDLEAYQAEQRAYIEAQTKVDIAADALAREATIAAEQRGITVNLLQSENQDKHFKSQFRIVKAINAMVNDKKVEGREAEVHQEGVLEMRNSEVKTFDGQGFVVPAFMGRKRATEAMNRAAIEQRDILVGTTTAGGHTVETELGGLIEFLDPSLTLRKLGATVLSDLVGNVDLPRRTARATAVAVAEQGALTESNPTFDKISLSPKRQGTFIEASLQLLQQSSVDVENMMRMDLALALEEIWELFAINGSGSSNQPRGILATSGIGSVVGGTNGAVPTWSNIVDLETALSSQNALKGQFLGYLTTPGIIGRLKKTARDPVAGGYIAEGPNDGSGLLNDYRFMTSTIVPSTLTKGTSSGICHAIIMGNFRELILAMWGGVQLIVNPYSRDTEGTVRITANAFFDVGVRHAQSFAAMQDALLS